MQTFLPYPDFRETFKCLDMKRLGKQRSEAIILIEAITTGNGWSKHPASKMWNGYKNALIEYYNLCIAEWVSRGYNNNMQMFPFGNVIYPPWLGNPEFHSSHRSNLLRKDPSYYGQFGWTEPNNLPYIWP